MLSCPDFRLFGHVVGEFCDEQLWERKYGDYSFVQTSSLLSLFNLTIASSFINHLGMQKGLHLNKTERGLLQGTLFAPSDYRLIFPVLFLLTNIYTFKLRKLHGGTLSVTFESNPE